MFLKPFFTSFLAIDTSKVFGFFGNATSIRKRVFHILFS
nr:MAG TPA: hypothetical protein [Caudoviricetes sp.]